VGHARAQVSDLQPQLQKLLSAGGRAAPPAKAPAIERAAAAAARAPADAPVPAGGAGAAAGEADEGAPPRPPADAGDNAAGACASPAGARTPAAPAAGAGWAAEGDPGEAGADAPHWLAAAGRAASGLADGIGARAHVPSPVGASGAVAVAATCSLAPAWSAGGQPAGGAGAAPGGGAAGGLPSSLCASADVHLPSCANAHSAPSTTAARMHGALYGEVPLNLGTPGAAGRGSAGRTVTPAMPSSPGPGRAQLAAGPQARVLATSTRPAGPWTGGRVSATGMCMPSRKPRLRAAGARALPCRPARSPLGAPAARSVRTRAC